MSFAKIHQSIYDGTLGENWKALVTFQNLLVLADTKGNVDLTLSALHKRTGIPLAILREGISVLEAPDPDSRTPDCDGRRIIRLDAHRSWGWNVINYVKYRDSKDLTNADRQRKWRSKQIQSSLSAPAVTPLRNVTDCYDVTPRNASESVSPSDSVPRGECEGGVSVELPPGFPATVAAAVVHAQFIGCPPVFAETTWTKASSRGGRDAKDVPIRSFRHYLANEWVYERGRVEKEKRNGHGTAAERREKFNDPKKYEKGF